MDELGKKEEMLREAGPSQVPKLVHTDYTAFKHENNLKSNIHIAKDDSKGLLDRLAAIEWLGREASPLYKAIRDLTNANGKLSNAAIELHQVLTGLSAHVDPSVRVTAIYALRKLENARARLGVDDGELELSRRPGEGLTGISDLGHPRSMPDVAKPVEEPTSQERPPHDLKTGALPRRPDDVIQAARRDIERHRLSHGLDLQPLLQRLVSEMRLLGTRGDPVQNKAVVEDIKYCFSVIGGNLQFTDEDRGLHDIPVVLDYRIPKGYPNGLFRLRLLASEVLETNKSDPKVLKLYSIGQKPVYEKSLFPHVRLPSEAGSASTDAKFPEEN